MSGAGRPPLPSVLTVEHEEGTVGVLDWGGDGRPVVLLHPNGFCGGLYQPVAERLAGSAVRPVAVDLPGHGRSSRPATHEAFSFVSMAKAVLAVVDRLHLVEPVAVGGSLGGGVAVLADQARPGVWQGLLLAEAVAFPSTGHAEGAPNPMADAARRRRRVFPDEATMVAAYSRRPPLADLAPEALEAYVQWGTRPVEGGIELRCDPEVEATVFERSGMPDCAPAAWEHLARLRCPVSVVAGRGSFLPDMFSAQAERSGATLQMVDGGHFVIHEDTERGAGLIERHLRLSPGGAHGRGRWG